MNKLSALTLHGLILGRVIVCPQDNATALFRGPLPSQGPLGCRRGVGCDCRDCFGCGNTLLPASQAHLGGRLLLASLGASSNIYGAAWVSLPAAEPSARAGSKRFPKGERGCKEMFPCQACSPLCLRRHKKLRCPTMLTGGHSRCALDQPEQRCDSGFCSTSGVRCCWSTALSKSKQQLLLLQTHCQPVRQAGVAREPPRTHLL